MHSSQVRFSYLHQLFFCKLARVHAVVIIKSVSVLQTLELITDNTLEGWSKKCTRYRCLANSSNKHINIVNMAIDKFQSFNNFDGNGSCQIIEGLLKCQVGYPSRCRVLAMVKL